MSYLDLIDGMLRTGACALSARFVTIQRTWLEERQQADGGFIGRGGASDIYYTDFALRALSLIAPDSKAFAAAARFLTARRSPPVDVIGVFSELSCEETLSQRGVTARLDRGPLTEIVARQALEGGGFGASGSGELSAYATFIGMLCRQMLGEPDLSKQTAQAVRRLRREGGGFSELEGQSQAQTNATAAAVAVLVMANDLQQEEAEEAAHFLRRAQAPDGGLRAHPAAPEGDLLSTYTGLLTLWTLGSADGIDLGAVGRFVRRVAHPAGGFAATPSDYGVDVEYTYYGIATLSLLRSITTVEEC